MLIEEHLHHPFIFTQIVRKVGGLSMGSVPPVMTKNANKKDVPLLKHLE